MLLHLIWNWIFFITNQKRMRLTSTCLQRWMASWIAFIIIWCGDYILYWISHHSKILDILEFLIPLALLFIATSAFAEANFEGERMIQVWQIMFSIFPIIFNKNLRKKLKVLNVLLVEKLFFVAYYGHQWWYVYSLAFCNTWYILVYVTVHISYRGQTESSGIP